MDHHWDFTAGSTKIGEEISTSVERIYTSNLNVLHALFKACEWETRAGRPVKW